MFSIALIKKVTKLSEMANQINFLFETSGILVLVFLSSRYTEHLVFVKKRSSGNDISSVTIEWPINSEIFNQDV